MGFGFNGLSSNVTISGGVTVAKVVATTLTGHQYGAGTATIGTVPANKKWTIVAISHQANTSGAIGMVSLCKFDGVNATELYVASTAGLTANSVINQSYGLSANPVLTTGKSITLVNDAAGNAAVSICYYEETV